MADVSNNTVTNGAKDLLGKKYGPLPFGAWLVVIAATAYFARKFVKGQQAAKEATTALEPEGYVIDSTGNEYPSIYKGTAGGVYPGVGSVYGAGTSGTPATSPTEVTNEGWLRRASEKLNAAGMWDAVYVNTALSKYISGAQLDQREQSVVNQAIKAEGQPSVNVINNSGSYNQSNVIRFVRPAGKAGVFAEYADGSVRWLGDADAQNAAQADAQRRGIDPTPVILPITDPIWKQSDVYQNNSQYYLWAERWASYVDPNQFKAREDIYGNDTQTRAQTDSIWQRSLAYLNSVGAKAGDTFYGKDNAQTRAWSNNAYTAAFGVGNG